MTHNINYLFSTFHWSLLLYGGLLVFFILITLKRLVSVINQYIFDGADGRSPYLMSVYILYLFNLCLIIHCIMHKSVLTITPFVLIVTFVNIQYNLIKMRLISYMTMKLSLVVKQIYSIIVNILYFSFYVYAIWYINKYIIAYSPITHTEYSNIVTYLASLLTSVSISEPFSPMVLVGINLFFSLSIYFFDKIERRSKLKLRGDLALVFASIVFFILRFDFKNNSDWIIITKAVLTLSIHFVYFYIAEKEYGSVMAHAKQINVKHGPAMQLLNNVEKSIITHDGEILETDRQKLGFLSSIMHRDSSLRDMILSEKTWFNPSKKKIFTILRQNELSIASQEKQISIENRRAYDSKF